MMEKCPPNPFNQFFYGFDNFGFSSKFGDFHMDISVKVKVDKTPKKKKNKGGLRLK